MNLDNVLSQLAADLNLDVNQLINFADEDHEGGYDHGHGTWPIGSMFGSEGKILYAVVRAMRPKHVVEFGTLYGCSSKHILAAMVKNKLGKLLSIDPDPKILRERFTEAELARWRFKREMGETAQLPTQIDIAFEDTGHEIEMTYVMCSRSIEQGAKLILVHDADHYVVGDKVREGMRLAFGQRSRIIRTDDSDCGFGYWVREWDTAE